MDLMRWNPTRGTVGFGRLLDDFFSPVSWEAGGTDAWNWQPAVDIFDQEDNVVIKAELPGVDKKDIHVDVKGRNLTLSGERTEEKEVTEEACYRRERSFGKFVRTFQLTSDVDPDRITAEYKDGVLNIVIPKSEDRKPKQITVH